MAFSLFIQTNQLIAINEWTLVGDRMKFK